MISLSHILILVLVILLFTGSRRLPKATQSIGEAVRNFKKGMRGESDIDITDTVKKIDDQ